MTTTGEQAEGRATLFKMLLKQRHLQEHRAFCREYDRIAAKMNPRPNTQHPSKAQFYRWLAGDMRRLPYPDHCRILEQMFPDWTVKQLFAPYSDGLAYVPEPSPTPAIEKEPTPAEPAQSGSARPVDHGRVADIVAAFSNRSEYIHEMPPRQLFAGAQDLRLMGLSLNVLCQNYPDRQLVEQLENGTTVKCLFLDPEGENITRREREEGDPPGHLSTLTRLNLDAIRRIKQKLSPESRDNLQIRTYDEPIRFNITVVDDATCVLQPYLPDNRGLEAPTIVMERQAEPGGLFDTFAQVFDATWNRATEAGE